MACKKGDLVRSPFDAAEGLLTLVFKFSSSVVAAVVAAVVEVPFLVVAVVVGCRSVGRRSSVGNPFSPCFLA